MHGATLSRWTMSWLGAAIVLLVAAEALFALGFADPVSAPRGAETLAVVHLVTAGWLGLLTIGSALQFVPVLAAGRLRAAAASLPSLILALLGDLALVGGFVALGRGAAAAPHLLAGGAALLVAGYGGGGMMLGLTLRAARPLAAVPRLVGLGLVGLAATLVLGAGLASGLAGLLPPDPAGRVADLLPFHIVFGLGGWLTATALAVSYRLLPMFLLAAEPSVGPKRLLRLAIAAFALVGLALAAVAVGFDARLAAGASATAAAAAIAVHGRDLAAIVRGRRRRDMEASGRASLLAVLTLWAAVALGLGAVLLGETARVVPTVVHLAGFGWLSGLGLAQLGKIVPFLTWLEYFGPVMGRRPTPRTQDLLPSRRLEPWYVVFHTGVWIGAAALLAEAPALYRFGALMQGVAVAALLVVFARTRRLAGVAAEHLRDGVDRPRLFVATIEPGSKR